MKKRKRNILFALSLPLFFASLIILIASRISPEFASLWVSGTSVFLKSVLLRVSNLFPFSLFELVLHLLPFTIGFWLFMLFRSGQEDLTRRFLSMLSAFLLVFSLFVNTHLVSYGVNADIQKRDFSESELCLVLDYLLKEVNSFDEIIYPTKDELSGELYSSYERLHFPNLYLTDEVPRIKKIQNWPVASRLGVLGGYSFLTSEINVNFSAPSYTRTFTAAHEMAHLFGIADEAEASFFAFVASVETYESGIMYSAYLSAFEYLGAELNKSNPKLFSEIYASLSEGAKKDISEYRSFYYENDGKLNEASNKANEAVLDFSDKNGENSYDAVAELLVSYIICEKLCN